MDSIKTSGGLNGRDFKLIRTFEHINWAEDILDKKTYLLNKFSKSYKTKIESPGIDDLYYSLGLDDNP